MKRFVPIAALLCLVGVLFIGQKGQALPLDVGYGTTSVLASTNTVVLTTQTFVNTSYQWCIEQVTVSPGSQNSTFSMYYSTNNPPLNTATTGYAVIISTNYFEAVWSYRTPFCAPPNNNLTLQESVTGSTIAYQAYTWKGWNQ